MPDSYAIRFHIYDAAEPTPFGFSIPTGHTNITLITRTTSGLVIESPHYGVNASGTNTLTYLNPFDNSADGIIGKDFDDWQFDGKATTEFPISLEAFDRVRAELNRYTSTPDQRSPVNYNLFSPTQSQWSCYSFAQHIYELAGGSQNTFVDLFTNSQLENVDNLIEWVYDDLDSVRDKLSDWVSGSADWLRDLADYLANRTGAIAGDLRDWIDKSADSFADALRDQLRRLIDPIVLDLDGNGIELTPRATSNVYFDMDGDGIKEQTGWVKPTDGLLAIDSNANGQIDNINELIGDLGRSGFAELISYDLNNDRVINTNDSIWSQFRVWLDSNSNGITDTGELRTLASLNIRSIDLGYTAVNFTAEGNRIHEQSIFEYTNGTTGLVADIWFDVSNVDTNSSVRLTGNLTVDNLPDIRGRGDVRSLRSVMLEDGALATLVTGFITQGTANLVNARNQAEQIIYRWAGVQSVDPSSRGGLFDGRKLAALEAFLGTPFTVQGVRNPNAQAIASLSASWNSLLDGILSRLLMSGPLGDAIVNSAVYVPEMDRLLTVQTPSELLLSFKNQAPIGDGLTVAGYWAAVLPLAREITQDIGGDPASSAFNTAVSVALRDSGLSPFSDLLSNGVIPLQPIPPLLPNAGAFRLTSGSDTLWLGQDRHAIYAAEGNDFVAVNPSWAQEQLIDGGSGDDQLFGGSSDDWIDGGVGADTMAGGGGNDTYTVDDLGDVVVEFQLSGTDHIRSSLNYALGPFVETLTLLGTSNINGIGNIMANSIAGNSANNILSGGLGSDTLTGAEGSDTFRFSLLSDSDLTQSTADLITDFTAAQGDLIDLSQIDSIGATPENEAFSYIGSSLFTSSGQVRSFVSGSTTFLALNTNSDLSAPEMLIALSGALSLQATNLIL